VTFANCLFRRFSWRKFPVYASAQVLGAFCASGVVYANYKSAIDTFEGGSMRTVPGYSANASAGIFCTYPAEFMTKTGQFFSEFVASSLLMFLIYALKDGMFSSRCLEPRLEVKVGADCGADNNIGAGPLTPLGLFFIIFGIGACFGWETGYAINLARDFGPRLMSYFLGYGHEVWSAGNYYFWVSRVVFRLHLSSFPKANVSRAILADHILQVPMIAPFFGCTFGGFLYDVLVFTGDSPLNEPYWGIFAWVPGMQHLNEMPSEHHDHDLEKNAV